MLVFLALLDTEEEKTKFQDLYDTYRELRLWIAKRHVHTVEDAEDCVQETFFYVAKNFDKVGDVHTKKTKAYLSTIVTGFAIDAFRDAEKHARAKQQMEQFYNEANEDDSFFERFDVQQVVLALEAVLSDESRVLLNLKYVYGYKSSEIAEMYHISDAGVRKKIQLAKENVREYLERSDRDGSIG